MTEPHDTFASWRKVTHPQMRRSQPDGEHDRGRGAMTGDRPPREVFQGTNFMTPEVLGHSKLRKGWAELSVGRGFITERLYGVTVRGADGKRLTPDPSACFRSEAEALAYIVSLGGLKPTRP